MEKNHDCEGYSLLDGHHRYTGLRRGELPPPPATEISREVAREKKIALCAVTRDPDGNLCVESPSGNNYNVERTARIDELGSYYWKYTCNCAARGACVHTEAANRYEMGEVAGDARGGDRDAQQDYEELGNAEM